MAVHFVLIEADSRRERHDYADRYELCQIIQKLQLIDRETQAIPLRIQSHWTVTCNHEPGLISCPD